MIIIFIFFIIISTTLLWILAERELGEVLREWELDWAAQQHRDNVARQWMQGELQQSMDAREESQRARADLEREQDLELERVREELERVREELDRERERAARHQQQMLQLQEELQLLQLLRLREELRQQLQASAPAPSNGTRSSRPGGSIGRRPVVESCAICHEGYGAGEEMAFSTGCSHYFHGPCIDPWLQGGQTTCPVCREDFSGSSSL
jgi:hypothetical protein